MDVMNGCYIEVYELCHQGISLLVVDLVITLIHAAATPDGWTFLIWTKQRGRFRLCLGDVRFV